MPTPAELAASAQLLYVAYYGRPADPGGLDFWIEKFSESDNVDQVLIDFGESDEFLVTRGNSDAVSLINGLYQQMFNRNADQAGMDYYREQLNTGQASLASIALDIANGAMEGTNDYQVLHNKIEVASIFTRLVREENADYNRVHLARARALLESVDETTASVAEGAVLATEFVSGLAVVVPPDPTNPTEPTDPTDPTDPTGPTGPTTPPVSRDPGKSYTLTKDADTFQSGTGNDRFSATDLTLGANDRILDSGQGIDRDVMTLALNAPWNIAADIKNVETINISFGQRAAMDDDPETTSDGTVNAEKISGATLVLRSGHSDFLGKATVSSLGNNKVVASTGITELTVTGLRGGSVDGGRATTVMVTGLAGTANQIKVAGTVELTNNTSNETTLITSGTSKVTYNTDAADITTTVQGSGNLMLVMAQDDVVAGTSIVNEKSSGTLTLDMTSDSTVDFDASNFEVDYIRVGDAKATMPAETTVSAKVADGQEIDVVAALSSLTVTSDKANASVIIDTDFNIDTLVVDDNSGLSIDITVAKDLTIATLTAGSNSVTLRGSGDVTVTNTDANTIDASGLSGDFELENASSASGKFTFTSARGTNTVVVADGVVNDYNGGGGTDNVDATAVTTGTLDFELQGGNDTVTLGGDATGSMIVAIDGGSGTDTIVLKNGTNLSAIGTFALRDVERFELENITEGSDDVDPSGVTVTFAGSQLSGESYTILTAEADDDATLNVEANAGSTDLSRLILQKIDTVVLTGRDGNDTLIGNSTNDRIISGGGMDQITGGRGNDKFEFATGNSTPTAMSKISDYRASDGTNNRESDTIVLSTTTIAGDLAAATARNVASAADSSDASEGDDIIALIDDGILTLFGLNRDRIDTLSEWIAVLGVSNVAEGNVAFEFGGNTYLATVSSSSVDNIIELTGVTGITAISETEAANTIHIA